MNGKIEKEADRVFSILVRKTYSEDGWCNCFVCGKPFLISDIDNGHCFKRGNHATRWLLDNCRPQCKSCNQFTITDDQYKEKLKEVIGIVRFEEIERLSRSTCKLSNVDGKELIAHINKKIRELNN